ncbi:MAG: HDIG domain-containing protein [Verrucomicrobia bacterium]|nr:HDIG domain-containing protein [Verrucomicrobiota bacterium]
MTHPPVFKGRAATENRLESDPRIRFFLFAVTALLALFLITLVANFAFILLLLGIAPRFSFGAGSYLIPPALAALVLTTLVSPRAGLLLVVLLGLGEFFLLHPDGRYLISSIVTGLSAVLFSQKMYRRSDLLRAGAGIGLVALFATVLSAGLNFTIARELILTEAISAAAVGLLGAILVGALFPILESTFDRTTDLSWLELASLDHPILRRLALEAPGTYLHSVLVGHLAEAAASASGAANPRACRAMAIYHDIGKLEKPEYFTENFNACDLDPHVACPAGSARPSANTTAPDSSGTSTNAPSNRNKTPAPEVRSSASAMTTFQGLTNPPSATPAPSLTPPKRLSSPSPMPPNPLPVPLKSPRLGMRISWWKNFMPNGKRKDTGTPAA